MKTYQLKEPTARAAKIAAVFYKLDDGTSVQAAPGASGIGSYWVMNPSDGSEGIVDAPTFEARYDEVPAGPLA